MVFFECEKYWFEFGELVWFDGGDVLYVFFWCYDEFVVYDVIRSVI